MLASWNCSEVEREQGCERECVKEWEGGITVCEVL